MHQPPEFLPRFSDHGVVAVGPPRSLLDELLAEGFLVRQFLMPGSTWEVKTRFHADARTWLFRCAVVRNGVEVGEPPWQPVFRDRTAEVAGREEDPEERTRFAREALDVHLGTCARLSHQLETTGTLLARGRPRTGKGRRLATVIVAAVLVAGALGVGGWFWLAPLAGGLSLAAPEPVSEEVPATLPPAKPPLTELENPPTPVTAVVPAPRPAPSPAPAPERPKVPVRASKPRPQQPAPSSLSPPPPEPPPAPPVSSEGEELTAEAPALPQATAPADPWRDVQVISIADPTRMRLREGGGIYLQGTLTLTEVPASVAGLRCITSRSSEGDGQEVMTLVLSQPLRVIVAHDQAVKKQPEWLKTLTPLGEILTATDPATGEEVVYRVYQQDFPSGKLVLGRNNGASAISRKARGLSGRGTRMYLVCLMPPGGSAP